MSIRLVLDLDLVQDHFRSYKATYTFLLTTSYINEIEQCECSHSLCSACQDALIDVHIDLLRSPLDLNVTWPEVILISDFDLDPSGSTNTCFYLS